MIHLKKKNTFSDNFEQNLFPSPIQNLENSNTETMNLSVSINENKPHDFYSILHQFLFLNNQSILLFSLMCFVFEPCAWTPILVFLGLKIMAMGNPEQFQKLEKHFSLEKVFFYIMNNNIFKI
jgi:hypothetical protein